MFRHLQRVQRAFAVRAPYGSSSLAVAVRKRYKIGQQPGSAILAPGGRTRRRNLAESTADGAILDADAMGGSLTAEGQVFAYGAAISRVESFFEWSNLYLALPLVIVGFIFAIWQIMQAKSAADEAERKAGNAETAANAAKAAAENARSQFKMMSVTVLLPQLRNLEEAVERAIHDEELHLLLHLLQDWRWQASTCREYLDGSIAAEAAAMTKIQTSVAAVTNLKPKILAFNEATDWTKETGRMRKTMTDVTANLGALTAQHTVKES
jgi:hypothetical protein